MEIPFKQYVIIPKKLKMSPGKMVSQGTHSTFMALDEQQKTDKKLIEEWKKAGMCVIVLQCKDSTQLMGISKYLDNWKVINHMYIDEGFTEVDMGTPTSLATGVLTPEHYWMFSELKLYRDRLGTIKEFFRKLFKK